MFGETENLHPDRVSSAEAVKQCERRGGGAFTGNARTAAGLLASNDPVLDWKAHVQDVFRTEIQTAQSLRFGRRGSLRDVGTSREPDLPISLRSNAVDWAEMTDRPARLPQGKNAGKSLQLASGTSTTTDKCRRGANP